MNLVLFVLAGLIAIAGALGVILAKQPVHQVLATVLNFLALAALYVSLSTEFMAVIQIIVYAGAVMVLFLFVIALLTVKRDPVEPEEEKLPNQKKAGFAAGGALMIMLALVGLLGQGKDAALATVDESFGTVKQFGWELLANNVLPFELMAFVLMVAVIGVVILVGRQKA